MKENKSDKQHDICKNRTVTTVNLIYKQALASALAYFLLLDLAMFFIGMDQVGPNNSISPCNSGFSLQDTHSIGPTAPYKCTFLPRQRVLPFHAHLSQFPELFFLTFVLYNSHSKKREAQPNKHVLTSIRANIHTCISSVFFITIVPIYSHGMHASCFININLPHHTHGQLMSTIIALGLCAESC